MASRNDGNAERRSASPAHARPAVARPRAGESQRSWNLRAVARGGGGVRSGRARPTRGRGNQERSDIQQTTEASHVWWFDRRTKVEITHGTAVGAAALSTLRPPRQRETQGHDPIRARRAKRG